MRYHGTFRRETNGYGFLKQVKDCYGDPLPDLPEIKGEPEVGVFISATTARRSLKTKGLVLAAIDGNEFTFSIADSPTHLGKQEAFALQPVRPSTV